MLITRKAGHLHLRLRPGRWSFSIHLGAGRGGRIAAASLEQKESGQSTVRAAAGRRGPAENEESRRTRTGGVWELMCEASTDQRPVGRPAGVGPGLMRVITGDAGPRGWRPGRAATTLRATCTALRRRHRSVHGVAPVPSAYGTYTPRRLRMATRFLSEIDTEPIAWVRRGEGAKREGAGRGARCPAPFPPPTAPPRPGRGQAAGSRTGRREATRRSDGTFSRATLCENRRHAVPMPCRCLK